MQVFRLLETLFEAFDEIANKHGVFKVETVSDCYGKFHDNYYRLRRHIAATQPEPSSLAIYCIYFYSFIPVAATGIPHPQAKHAEIMARFAIGILKKMDHLSKKLELMFGPDTGELKLRKYI